MQLARRGAVGLMVLDDGSRCIAAGNGRCGNVSAVWSLVPGQSAAA